jgi:membrane protease YdiL (CAAX protease family)
MIGAYVVVFAVAVWRVKAAGVVLPRLFGPRPTLADMPLLAMILPLALLTAGAVTIIFVPISYLAPEFVEHTVLADTPGMDVSSPAQFALLFIVLAVAAPIAEEFIFRGVIMHRLARRFDERTGVIGSSILFAVLHVEWAGHLVMGICFALLYLRTRSLWMSIAAHGAYNALIAIPMGWSLLHERTTRDTTTLADLRGQLPMGIVAFVAGWALMWLYLDRYWGKGQVAKVVAGPLPYDDATR